MNKQREKNERAEFNKIYKFELGQDLNLNLFLLCNQIPTGTWNTMKSFYLRPFLFMPFDHLTR